MRKWKPNTRATEKSGSQTSVFQQHSPWERNMQAACVAALAGAKPTGAKVNCLTKCTLPYIPARRSLHAAFTVHQHCEVPVPVPTSQMKALRHRGIE